MHICTDTVALHCDPKQAQNGNRTTLCPGHAWNGGTDVVVDVNLLKNEGVCGRVDFWWWGSPPVFFL